MVETYKENYKKPPKSNAKPIQYVVEGSCWICVSHKCDKDGYPKATRNNKDIGLHRFVYKDFNLVEIPEGMVVKHSCDNRKCINPEHLSLGTSQENTEEREERSRGAKGTRVGTAKLTDEQVIEIRNLLKNGSGKMELARAFGVGRRTISSIGKGERWKHLL